MSTDNAMWRSSMVAARSPAATVAINSQTNLSYNPESLNKNRNSDGRYRLSPTP